MAPRKQTTVTEEQAPAPAAATRTPCDSSPQPPRPRVSWPGKRGEGASMHIEAIDRAEAEAKRFLERIKEYKAAQKRTDEERAAYAKKNGRAHKAPLYPYNVPRESGAIRRASMDLTRALADLRSYAR